MKRQSEKTAAREAEAKPFRQALIQQIGHCEACHHDPLRAPWGGIRWKLVVHEIANGPWRQAALDKPYAVLVTCWWCNAHELTNKMEWPEARQLAALKRSRPQDYDLESYRQLKYPTNAPEAITEGEVEAWFEVEQGIRRRSRNE